MSSRVRQDEPPGRSRQRLIANLNETPRPACRLNFRLTFLSFVYFGKRPVLLDLCIADGYPASSGDFDHSCHAEACAYSAADCRTMPRKRDVNLSHCGNAISRMWSPFGWVRNGGLTRRRNAASGHKMFIAAGSDFFGKFTTQDAFLILAT